MVSRVSQNEAQGATWSKQLKRNGGMGGGGGNGPNDDDDADEEISEFAKWRLEKTLGLNTSGYDSDGGRDQRGLQNFAAT